ncbi:transposase [Pseudomonas guariconensis]|uniref:transposase n=1 Tax=Pseudomonas guariconensis TaxID=1288410 RepID=UPI0018A9B4F1|nr:transposase [Pseudomonas guariconensis]MBF8720184.1 transposase [Pseudomonas guariconensis]
MSEQTIQYPRQLPKPLQDGYELETTNPKMATPMASGRIRERRRAVEVPTRIKVKWIMNDAQAAFFEAWFSRTLVEGTKWFDAEVKTTQGLMPRTCRILGIYEGPRLVGGRYWEFSATLELRERPMMPPGWEEFPDYWFNMNILDLAMNGRGHWPEA